MPSLIGRIVNHVYLHSSSIVSISRRPREGSGWAACTDVSCQLLSLLACSFLAPTSEVGAKKLTPSLQHFTCSSCRWYVHAHAHTIATMRGQYAATSLQGLPNWNQPYPEIAILRNSVHKSLESTHKLMGLYMEVLISGIILQYKVSTLLSCFLQGV